MFEFLIDLIQHLVLTTAKSRKCIYGENSLKKTQDGLNDKLTS